MLHKSDCLETDPQEFYKDTLFPVCCLKKKVKAELEELRKE